TRQPPRRPSNLGIAGIVGAARMVDKARAHNDETLGEFLYGGESGLDRKVLDFLGISEEEFAEAVDEHDDESLNQWIGERSNVAQEAIDQFNRTELEQLPETDEYKQRLKDRIAKYAPGSTNIKTILQSIELDDWGNFWQKDLTKKPPRSPRARDVAGIFGVARMADKARAVRTGKNGEYRFGADSGQDRKILEFLKVSEEDFQEAAVKNPNDCELGEWVLERSRVQPKEIDDFNRAMANRGAEDAEARVYLESRIREIDPSRTDISTWAELQDLDDERGFGIVDLGRHAPRSPYSTDIAGIAGLARTLDKARAFKADSIGDYWYGEDSGHDRQVLQFIGVTPQEFLELVGDLRGDNDVTDWVRANARKTSDDIVAFNDEMINRRPVTERHRAFFAKLINKLDPRRTDIQTFFDLMVFADEKEFGTRMITRS
ncbi:MAG: DUF5069 domain-containing protein, partial [Candidatus Poribacteria bacterium]|nr:DUF5069 domain-containing protein [Candidatus Poribacteria bacterium]